jgi:predicted molibdopterin-dependent oxidoreductase YjgC
MIRVNVGDKFSVILVTSRGLKHYNVGSMTVRTVRNVNVQSSPEVSV